MTRRKVNTGNHRTKVKNLGGTPTYPFKSLLPKWPIDVFIWASDRV